MKTRSNAGSMRVRVLSFLWAGMLGFLFPFELLQAEGFRDLPEGACAIGKIGGKIAFADDPSAITHNPANLVSIKEPALQINSVLNYVQTDYSGSTESDQSKQPWSLLPGVYMSAPLLDHRAAIGLGFNIPYGIAVGWDPQGRFKQQLAESVSYKANLMVADLNPTFSVKATERLQIGVGLDLYYSRVEQRTWLPSALFGTGSQSKLTGDDYAFGWNGAVTFDLTKRQRVAATYRSSFDMNYSGHNEYWTLPTGSGKSSFEGTIPFPNIVGLAYGVQFTDTLRVELNTEWIEWSRHESLDIEDSWPIPGASTYSQEANWKNVWTYGIGGDWNFVEHWTLRSGFIFYETPIPDRTYTPLVPSQESSLVSIGLGYEKEHQAVDLGYAYRLPNSRSVHHNQTAAYNGNYDYQMHFIAFSYTYKF